MEALRLLGGGRHLLGGGRGLLGDRGDLADAALGALGLGGDLLDRAGDLGDALGHRLDGECRSPRTPRASARPWRRRRPCAWRPRRRQRRRGRVSAWISEISEEISAAAPWELLGQLADLLGDDREPAALLAGAGGLDGGVQRQQVRLLGDPADRVDDAADPLGLARTDPRSHRRPASELSATWRIASVARTAASARPRGRRRAPRSAASAVDGGGRRRSPRRRGRPPGRPRGWPRPCAPGARRPARRRRRRRRSRRPRARPRRRWTRSAPEAALTEPAPSDTSPISAPSCSRIAP